MDEIKQVMINEAIEKHGKIYPCERSKIFENSFTQEGDMLIFWFNDESGSTRIITKNIQGEKKHDLFKVRE